MGNYADHTPALQPPWLRDPRGMDALHSGKGDTKDSIVERMKDAVCSRFPLKAPSDGLNNLGQERNIPRGGAESDASYATRLVAAWTSWQKAGTGEGVVRALVDAGYPNALVAQQRSMWFQIDGSGALVMTARPAEEWRIDGNAALWNRFVVVLPAPFPFVGAVPADGSLEASRVASIILSWKPALSVCSGIAVLANSTDITWDYYPAGATWNSWGRSTWDTHAAAADHTTWTPRN